MFQQLPQIVFCIYYALSLFYCDNKFNVFVSGEHPLASFIFFLN